jgi:polyribonucleotide nucleotidyltransferase
VKLSGLPFNGTLGAVKVGYDGESYLLNPKKSELEKSLLDLTVAGTESAVMMVESEAKELSEDVMLGAVKYGHEQMQSIIKAIDEFISEVGITKLEWNPAQMDDTAYLSLKDKYKDKISDAYAITKKQDRNEALSKIKEEVLANDLNEEGDNESDILSYFSKAQKSIVRDRIIAGEKRIDGRDSSTVRAIDVKIGVLPRTHGSALFTRGETQALVVTTLGTIKMPK